MHKDIADYLTAVGEAAAGKARVDLAKAAAETPELDRHIWTGKARRLVIRAFSQTMRK